MGKRKLDQLSEVYGLLPSPETKRIMTCATHGEKHECKWDDTNNSTVAESDDSRLVSGVDFPERLPCDITWAIFSRLSFPERIKCMQVSKAWYACLAGWSGMWEDIHISLPESVKDGWQKAIPEPETGHVIKRFSFFGNTVQMKKTFDTLRRRNQCRIQSMVIGSIYAWDTVDISSAEQISTLGSLLELTGQSLTSLEFRDAIFSADMLMDKILLACKNLRTLICKMENDQPTAPTWSPSPSIEGTWITELVWSAEVILPLDLFLPLCRCLELLVIDSSEFGPSDNNKNVLQRIDTLCPSLRHVYCLDSDAISSLEIADLRRTSIIPAITIAGLQSISLSHMDQLQDADLTPLFERNHNTLEFLSIDHYQPLNQCWSVLAACGAKRLKKLCLSHPAPTQSLDHMIEQCPALEDVALYYCCSNATLLALSKLKSLRSLVVAYNDENNTSTEGVLTFTMALAASLPLLEKLHLRSGFVTDSVLETLGQIKTLKNIHLGDCTQLTTTGLLRFIESLGTNTQIESLGLTGIDAVTDKVVLAMGQRLEHVCHLDLSGCSRVSDKGVLGLIFHNGRKRLRQLLLQDCIGITFGTHSRIKQALGMEHHIVIAL